MKCPFTGQDCPVYDTRGAIQECVMEVEELGLEECPEEAQDE